MGEEPEAVSWGWHPGAPRGGSGVVAWEAAAAIYAARSDCMRIHAGTLGTLLREVGCSLSGHDRVLCPGKKKKVHPQ